MEIGEIQSVEILLDSGAHILHSSLKALISLRDREKAQNIVGILAKTLARQQRELWKFALQNLPTEIVQSLGLDENYPLDDKAFHVVQALKKWRIPVPAVYDTVEPGPVYHLECLSPSWAQVLYDAGFVKTNSPLHGRTPLMCVCDNFWETNFNDMLALINWFQDHGASIYTSLPISGNRRSINRGSGCGLEVDVPSLTYPTLHYFTESLGFISANEVRTLDRFQTSGKNLFLFSKLLEDKTTDPCHCYCVVNGCTPASKFISGVYTTVLLWEDDITNYVIKYMRSIKSTILDKTEIDIAFDFIRVITFERLGMRHTCCRYTMRTRNRRFRRYEVPSLLEVAEVEEIREEDRYLAELLDTLVEEFERKFRELDVPLSQFVEEYLWPRVDEAMEEQDEVSSEDLHAIRDIGVVLS